jgi:hypothetical protein
MGYRYVVNRKIRVSMLISNYLLQNNDILKAKAKAIGAQTIVQKQPVLILIKYTLQKIKGREFTFCTKGKKKDI